MASLADVFVQVLPDTDKFEPDLRKKLDRVDARKSGDAVGRSFGSGLLGSVGKIAAGVGALLAGAQIGSYLSDAVDRASDMNETLNKSNVIFGDQSAAMQAWASNAARQFGLTRGQALEAASGFGNMFAQLGFAGQAAAGMSQQVVQLATDLGSFNNLPTAEVADMISAAFRGEYDSLQRLIPNINAARVEQEALAVTGKSSAKELTAAEKAAATLAIVQRDGAAAANDFAETSGGLANQQKILAAQMGSLQGKIGEALLPAFAAVAQVVNEKVFPVLNDLADRYLPVAADAISGLAEGFDLSDLSGTFERVRDALSGLDAGQAREDIGAITASFRDLAPLAGELAEQLPTLQDVLSVTATVMGWLSDHTDELARMMPFLVGGIIAWKVAQIGANAAQLASIPLRIGELLVNRQLVASNQALVASRAELVGATLAQTGAEKASTGAKTGGFLATLRATAANAAHAASSLVVRGATLAWTGVQWALNAALTANPIGIVIALIAALVAGIVIAYQRSETFRNVVQGVWRAVGDAVRTVVDWWTNTAMPAIQRFWDNLTGGFTRVKDSIVAAWDGIKDGAGAAWSWIDERVIEPFRRGVERIKGFLDGIKDAWSGVKDAFGAFFGGGGGGGGAAGGGKGGAAFPLPRGTYRVGGGLNSYPGHTGQDFPVPTGTPVYAAISGMARSIDLGGRSYGRYVRILGANGVEAISAHLSRALANGYVSAGQLIGFSGSSGNSSGPHLHQEFRQDGRVLDPRRYLMFDRGGWLMPGTTVAVNKTGRPERVLTADQEEALSRPSVSYTIVAPPAEMLAELRAAQRLDALRYRTVG